MFGEADYNIDSIEQKLYALIDECEIFRLANDETMHPFLFNKRREQYRSEIEALERELEEWEAWRNELLQEYADELDTSVDASSESFEKTFYELACVEGVNAGSGSRHAMLSGWPE